MFPIVLTMLLLRIARSARVITRSAVVAFCEEQHEVVT